MRVWYNKQTMNRRNMQERKRSILVFDTDDRGCGAMAAASCQCCEVKASLRPCYCNLLERMHTSFHPPAVNRRDQEKFMYEKRIQTNTVTNSCSSMASNQHWEHAKHTSCVMFMSKQICHMYVMYRTRACMFGNLHN